MFVVFRMLEVSGHRTFPMAVPQFPQRRGQDLFSGGLGGIREGSTFTTGRLGD